MAKESPFLRYILDDVLAGIDGISHRFMFGGYAIYKDGLIFGLIAYDVLYFKVGALNQAKYVEAGAEPFVFEGKGKPMQMSYWTVPDAVMEDPATLRLWIDEALTVSSQVKRKSKK